MNKIAIEALEYNKIKEIIKSYAISEYGIELIEKLEPSVDINSIKGWLNETTECRKIIDKSSSIPLSSLKEISGVTLKLQKELIMNGEELWKILQIIKSAKKLREFMIDKETIAPRVSSYAFSMLETEELLEELQRCIFEGRIEDRATPTLQKLRKKIRIAEDNIKIKLESLLKSSNLRGAIQENIISMRNDRYVIPVKRDYKSQISGDVLDVSASGSTVFIEPKEVRKLHDELNLLKYEEEKEEYKILSELSSMAILNKREININIEVMAYYDFLFAKAKYSREIHGTEVKVNRGGFTDIKKAKHPLIKDPIPLDFYIGSDYRALVITGPNTGGKTVLLKTVGLLTMMVQSGIHVPVSEESEFAIFNDILVDIGDGQSIENSLSTFSSHIKNIISILECADKNSLVILDEVGSGTDPAEGMGIAISILEEIFKKQSIIIATTHYNEIKEFAKSTNGFKNGCMGFDINTLKPLYKLSIGKSGESNAFLIALRLGMKRELIERAHKITYKEEKSYEDFNEKFVTEPKLLEKDIVEKHIESTNKVREKQENLDRVKKSKIKSNFNVGDSVHITSLNKTGIIYEAENSKGEIGVMVMKKKLKVNKKRLKLLAEAKDLYPEDYDMDIVFESVENRKKRKKMGKRHVEGMIVDIE